MQSRGQMIPSFHFIPGFIINRRRREAFFMIASMVICTMLLATSTPLAADYTIYLAQTQ